MAFGLATLGAAVFAGSSFATEDDDPPTIAGTPMVGEVLTAIPDDEDFDGLYKWQSCDPSVADCFASHSHNDPAWSDLPGPDNLHENPTYTPVSSDVGNFIRVLTHENSLGSKWNASDPVGPVVDRPAPFVAAPITPEHGVNVLASPVAGSVLVKLPGESGFQPLEGGVTKIPVNTVVDTRGSRIHITAATGSLGDRTPDQSVDFYDGLFRIVQQADLNSAAVAQLAQKLSCGAKKAKQAKASSGGPVARSAGKRRRRLWGSGHGGYATSGRGGTGSVRGTTWLTQDTCKGTLFRVTEGLGIAITDFDLDKQVELGPGQSYFAKNR